MVANEASSQSAARGRLRSFLDDLNADVPVLIDNGSVARAYGVDTIPRTVLIDKEGIIVDILSGVSEGRLAARIDELIQ